MVRKSKKKPMKTLVKFLENKGSGKRSEKMLKNIY